jgi:hypothetical protein
MQHIELPRGRRACLGVQPRRFVQPTGTVMRQRFIQQILETGGRHAGKRESRRAGRASEGDSHPG